MGQVQNTLLTGTRIIEEPVNHVRQRRLQCSHKSCLLLKYPHSSTGIPHRDIVCINIFGIRNIQQSKRFRRTHTVQCNTQRIQSQYVKQNGSTSKNYGDTNSTCLHHGHYQQQQRRKCRKTKKTRPSPTTSTSILLVTQMVQTNRKIMHQEESCTH